MEFKKSQNSCLSLGEWAQAGPGLAVELSYNSINSPGGPASLGPAALTRCHTHRWITHLTPDTTRTLNSSSEHTPRGHHCLPSMWLWPPIVLITLCPRELRTLKAPVCGLGPACEAWLARSRSGMERCQWNWPAQPVNTVTQWHPRRDQMVSVVNKVANILLRFWRFLASLNYSKIDPFKLSFN